MKLINILLPLFFLTTNTHTVFAQNNNSPSAGSIRVCDDSNADEETSALRKELVALLRDKKFAAIEDTLKDREARTLKGEFRDQSLYRLTKFADSAEPELEPLMNEWVRNNPASFMALMVRANFHLAVGWKKRGNKFSNATSQDQFDAMNESFKKAGSDLAASSKLAPVSVLPYSGLINIAGSMAQSNDKIQDVLLRANKIDPQNYVVRKMAIWRLSPRWGGSFDALDKIIEQAKSSKLNAADLRRLEYSVLFEKGSHFKDVEKRPLEALPYFMQAAKMCDSYQAWAEVSSIEYTREDWPQVEAAMNQYMRLHPDTAWGYNRRGWALQQQGRLKDAIADFKRSSELGNDYAQNKMGYFYMTGNGVPKDLAQARTLFAKANVQGNKTAKANLEYLARTLESK